MNCSAGAQIAASPPPTSLTRPNPVGQTIQTRIDTVAVMPFTNATNETDLDWLCMGIPETITGDLLTLDDFVVVERLQLWKVMEELALQLTGAVDDETVVEIGKLLGADYLIVGAFQKMGDTLRLTARFVEAESGSIMQSAKVTGGMNDVFDLQDQIVAELAVSLKRDAERTKDAISLADPTPSIDAFQRFGQATLLEARRDYPGAVAELKAALELDPAFEMARARLADVWWPLQAGNSWGYEVSSTGVGEQRPVSPRIRTATGQTGFEGRICFALVTSGADNSTEYYLNGRAGIELLGNSSTLEGEPTKSFIFSPARLLFPYDLSVGKEWETQSSAWFVEEGRGSGLIPYHHAVLRIEQIEVPGVGALQCFVIQTDPLLPGSGDSMTCWFTPGVGIVKEVFGSGAKTRPGEPPTMIHLLKSFSFSSDITIRY
ncbi:CsgG/HfaB family protein [Gemmatimonadota bacterium]